MIQEDQAVGEAETQMTLEMEVQEGLWMTTIDDWLEPYKKW